VISSSQPGGRESSGQLDGVRFFPVKLGRFVLLGEDRSDPRQFPQSNTGELGGAEKRGDDVVSRPHHAGTNMRSPGHGQQAGSPWSRRSLARLRVGRVLCKGTIPRGRRTPT